MVLQYCIFLMAIFAPLSSATGSGPDLCDISDGTLTIEAKEQTRGWVEQPNFRGSFDIISSCMSTIFICTWSMLVLNVPSPGERQLTTISRRMLWMCIAIIGPEFPLTFAAGQWSRAKQSMQAFHAAGYSGWTMRHAFFADMGGFNLKSRDGTRFPVTGKQLLWLVENGKVDYPQVSAEELSDKSKQDLLVRVLAAFQVTYFILQCIGRAAQNLAISTLELNTLAIVVCSLMTSYAWLYKGSDIAVPFTIDCAYDMDELSQGRMWDLTPLDFIDDHTPGYSVNVQPFLGRPVIPAERPIQRIPNDRFPTNPYGAQEYLLCLASLVFTGLHIAGWNFAFASRTEQILWRTASVLMFTITALFWLLETIASWNRLGRWRKLQSWLAARLTRTYFQDTEVAAKRERVDSESGCTLERKPFPRPWEFCTITTLAIVYGAARLFLIVEAFVEFRELPTSAFVCVDWSSYIPHL